MTGDYSRGTIFVKMSHVLDILPQLILNGIIAGAIYSLVALGLSLVYGVLKFINMAHGEFAMCGAYSFFLFYVFLKWPFFASLIFAIILTILLGFLIERTIYRPILNSPPLIPLIISLGVSFMLQALAIIFFKPDVRSLSLTGEINTHILFNGAIAITNAQIVILLIVPILVLALFLFLKKTKIGKAIRATADNREVAEVIGINTSRIISISFMIGSILAAIAGIAIAFDQNLFPTMGLRVGLKAFAAIILGGIGNIPGAIVGSFIIGLAENIGIGIMIGNFSMPSGYKETFAFGILILILLLRPQGICRT